MQENGAKKIKVATAKSRYELIWENREIRWDELLRKLTSANRTSETVDEFKAMTKKDQDSIKDIGGFVGGTLINGRRKNGYVESRSMITLDMDSGQEGMLEDIEAFATAEFVVYSTHKHTSQKPRLRFIIPLTREVTAEEYEPLARKLADDLGVGMDCFDDTTFEATRLMYWPSTSRDGEFIGKEIKGDWTDPDAVLAEYKDWRDPTSWPKSSRESTKQIHQGDKAGDPLAKPGIIGTFCNCYTITEAIAKFLSEVYIPCENGRFTFASGSTSGGLIVYDDKWAYSNHGTDPAHGLLCNAFDLVRIHKYGELDINVTSDMSPHEWPSYQAMKQMAEEDPIIKELVAKRAVSKRTSALEDFDGVLKPIDESEGWAQKLKYNKRGELIENYQTALLILENDPNLKGLVGLNSFKGFPELRAKTPWNRVPGQYWTDTDEAQLRGYLNTIYGIKMFGFVKDALLAALDHNAFNPVKEYIERATWDGEPRAETLFIKYLGAEDNPYVRTVTRKMLVAAVSRIYQPGCKFDYMVTLVGKQGIGKSYLINKLGNGWSSDTLSDIRGKESYEALDGVWLMEMGELVALKKTDRESIKLFISKTEDTYRRAYAHNTTVNKRRCIFIGTTNDENFLNDATGARRFLVIDTKEENIQQRVWNGLDESEVAQIWAETKVLYDSGEKIMEMPEEVNKAAVEEQERHAEDNPNVGIIGEWLSKKIPSNWSRKTIEERARYCRATEDFNSGTTKVDFDGSDIAETERNRICAAEVWCECYQRPIGELNKLESRNINEALRMLGWKADKFPRIFGPYGKQRGFTR